MRRTLLAAGLTLAVVPAALAAPAMTLVATQMRAEASSHSEIVQSIPAQAEILVTGCGKIWCSASWRDISGYVRATAVSVVGPQGPGVIYADEPPPRPVIVGPPVVVAPWPYYGYGWGYHYWRRW